MLNTVSKETWGNKSDSEDQHLIFAIFLSWRKVVKMTFITCWVKQRSKRVPKGLLLTWSIESALNLADGVGRLEGKGLHCNLAEECYRIDCISWVWHNICEPIQAAWVTYLYGTGHTYKASRTLDFFLSFTVKSLRCQKKAHCNFVATFSYRDLK